MATRLIHRIVRPMSAPFRKKRMALMVELLNLQDHDKVIDVGGYPGNWEFINVSPEVLMINVEDEHWERGRFKKVRGDGRRLDQADLSFDVSYSNSVIEHVGTKDDQASFAKELRRVGRRYYIQTPYKHFPLEVHLLAPFVQYLPPKLAKRLLRWITPHGWITRADQKWINDFVDQTRLLTKREMREFFPDAEHYEEKFLGLTKSLIAVRR